MGVPFILLLMVHDLKSEIRGKDETIIRLIRENEEMKMTLNFLVENELKEVIDTVN